MFSCIGFKRGGERVTWAAAFAALAAFGALAALVGLVRLRSTATIGGGERGGREDGRSAEQTECNCSGTAVG